jgi:hypothetical protein
LVQFKVEFNSFSTEVLHTEKQILEATESYGYDQESGILLLL